MKNHSQNAESSFRNETDYKREDAYIRAKKKVDSIKGFYWHLAVYLVINAFIVISIVSQSHVSFMSFQVFSIPLFWGVGLFFHFIGVFGPDIFFSQNWEERKIKQFMEKENQL